MGRHKVGGAACLTLVENYCQTWDQKNYYGKKQANQDKREELNFLLLRQAYLAKKIQLSHACDWSLQLATLMTVQYQIQAWYRKQAERIKHQSRVSEYQESEQTRIYHHEIHKKHIKKT